jgi:formate hydrogenlyase transcriptional activator
VAEESRWPQLPERAKPFGVNSGCYLPLATARRRLGVLVFACKQAGAYDTADVDFLQQVARPPSSNFRTFRDKPWVK